ncbi:MAG: hypothetical protein LC808_43155, partial [Actinobacteria bacterium]|nr:hypothetical protein [Actinomycetota bacterium]
ELAYDAGIAALSQQDGTLGNLRNRASGLLSAAVIVTSVSAGLGLTTTDPAKGPRLSHGAAVALLSILLAIGALMMSILWPVKHWGFGPDVRVILSEMDEGQDIDRIRRYIAGEMVLARGRNDKTLRRLQRTYQCSAVLLVVEVLVLVVALS